MDVCREITFKNLKTADPCIEMRRAGSLSVGRGSSASTDYLSTAYCLKDFQLNPQAFQHLNLGHAHTNASENFFNM